MQSRATRPASRGMGHMWVSDMQNWKLWDFGRKIRELITLFGFAFVSFFLALVDVLGSSFYPLKPDH